MKTSFRICILTAVAVATACGDGGSEGVLARAGDHDFTVDEAVRLLAGQPDLANEPQVAVALAELWVDYTLLASALADDSTLSDLDMGPMIQGRVDQEMIMAFRSAVILGDTTIADAELRELYETRAPGARVRARHILLGFPLQATAEQRDSVHAEAEALRSRILAGESFEALARQYSQDPGSASNGGDLGFFTRDDMVEPFADAAFALDTGEISDIVESPMGYHIIRTEEKEVPTFDEVAPQFRREVLTRRSQAAESVYVTDMRDAAHLEFKPDVTEVVRRMVQDPSVALSSRARRRVLVDYDGGKLTVGDLQTFMQSQLPAGRAQLARLPDSLLVENVLQGLTQRKLLVAKAREDGFAPEEAYVDSLEAAVKAQLLEVAGSLGLTNIEPEGSESTDQAIDRQVEALLRGIVSGQRDVIPLGAVAIALREQASARVFETVAPAVVQGVAVVRGPAPPPPAVRPSPPPQGAPTAPPPDTSGRTNGG